MLSAIASVPDLLLEVNMIPELGTETSIWAFKKFTLQIAGCTRKKKQNIYTNPYNKSVFYESINIHISNGYNLSIAIQVLL